MERHFCVCHDPLPKCQPYPLHPKIHKNEKFSKKTRHRNSWVRTEEPEGVHCRKTDQINREE
jgi:hypothetical protein